MNEIVSKQAPAIVPIFVLKDCMLHGGFGVLDSQMVLHIFRRTLLHSLVALDCVS